MDILVAEHYAMSIPVAIDASASDDYPRRGIGNYVYNLVEALVADAQINLAQVSLVDHRAYKKLPELVWELAGFGIEGTRRVITKNESHILHAPNCIAPERVASSAARVVTVHDLAFERYPEDFSAKTGWKYRTFTRRSVERADAVICVSGATAADVVNTYRVDQANVHVIPNAACLPRATGVPVEPERPADGRPAKPYILAIGDIRKKKNWQRLVTAWQHSGLSESLVIAGTDGQNLTSDLARELAAGGAHLTGFVDDFELDRLLCGASMIVHPSLFEGFGLVLTEAMVRGIPIACSDIPSLSETAGGCATLFDPLSVDNLAEALTHTLQNRHRLAQASLTRSADFSWQHSAQLTADVYRTVAGLKVLKTAAVCA